MLTTLNGAQMMNLMKKTSSRFSPSLVCLLMLFFLISAGSAGGHTSENTVVPGGSIHDLVLMPGTVDRFLLIHINSVWQSVDGGESFQWNLYLPSHYPVDMSPHLETSPGHPGVAVVTRGLYLEPDRDAVLVTRDYGETWEEHLTPLRTFSFNHALNTASLSPTLPVMIVTADSGLMFSPDYGETWSVNYSIREGRISFFHPTDPNMLYVFGRTEEGEVGLFRSPDFGSSWVNIFPAEYLFHVVDASINPVTPNHMLIRLSRHLDWGYRQSLDGGETWSELTGCPGTPRIAQDGSLVALTEENLFRSTDYGETWETVFPEENPWPTVTGSYNLYPTHLVQHPENPEEFWIHMAGLLFHTTNTGEHWERVADGFSDGIQDIQVSLYDTDNLIVKNPASLRWRSENGGQNWAHYNADYLNEYWMSLLDPDLHMRRSHMYVEETDTVFQVNTVEVTRDGGESWDAFDISVLRDHSGRIESLCVNELDHDSWYFSADLYWHPGIPYNYVTHDGGENWAAIPELQTNRGTFHSDPSNPDRVYFLGRESGLYRSDDGGDTFTLVEDLFLNQEMIIHPHSGAICIFSSNGWVFVSDDFGETLTQLEDVDHFDSAFQFLPGEERTLLRSSAEGLDRSDDLGASWYHYYTPIAPAYSQETFRVCDDGTMFIGTRTGKVWRISNLFTDVEEEIVELTRGFQLDSVYPNPFNGQTRITYTIPRAGTVTIQVFDLLGREVTHLDQPNLTAGQHCTTWNTTSLGLASGTYIVRLSQGNQQVATRAMLVK